MGYKFSKGYVRSRLLPVVSGLDRRNLSPAGRMSSVVNIIRAAHWVPLASQIVQFTASRVSEPDKSAVYL